ncbi:MAG: DUF3617 domain-containing protein [Sulfurovum sp.]|nr:DUF3617 domain-containing protein [Sulfurovum sp.]
MKRIYRIPLATLSIIYTFGTVAEADINMKEGLWTITSKTDMSGLPMAIPESSFTQCITKKDLLPRGENKEAESQCKIIEQKISGNTITWKMECDTGEGVKTKISGSITYNGNTMHGTTETITFVPQMGEMKMKQTMTGKRVGECKK